MRRPDLPARSSQPPCLRSLACQSGRPRGQDHLHNNHHKLIPNQLRTAERQKTKDETRTLRRAGARRTLDPVARCTSSLIVRLRRLVVARESAPAEPRFVARIALVRVVARARRSWSCAKSASDDGAERSNPDASLGRSESPTRSGSAPRWRGRSAPDMEVSNSFGGVCWYWDVVQYGRGVGMWLRARVFVTWIGF